MPGAWEILNNNQVLCAILHTENTTMAWSLGFRNLIIPGQVTALQGMPYDHARNAACMAALDGGFQWLFFLDSDVVPPRDAIPRLMAHQQPIVSGLYCRRSKPAAIPVMLKGDKWITQYPDNSLLEVDLVGAGCLLIHRSVLQNFPPQAPGKHWFRWAVDLKTDAPDGYALSEDFTFCKHAREKMGLKILVDTSIKCRHIGFAQATYGQFEPLDTIPI